MKHLPVKIIGALNLSNVADHPSIHPSIHLFMNRTWPLSSEG